MFRTSRPRNALALASRNAKAEAHRGIATIWNGMATAATAVPACFLFSLSGVIFLLGYDGLAYVLGLLGGLVLVTFMLTPPLQKSGAVTIPEYFGHRYGLAARTLAAIIVVVSSGLLLVAELAFAGSIGSRILGVPPLWIVLATLAVAMTIALVGGWRAAAKSGVVLYVAIFAAFVAALIAAKTSGIGLPQVMYGEALREVAALETGILELGLGDLKSLTPNSKPFLQLDPLNFSALIVSLIAGMAVMPHVVGRHLVYSNARDAQFSAAWTTLFVFLLLVTAPAIAAYAKLEIYTTIAKSTTYDELPPWLETASRFDLVRFTGSRSRCWRTSRMPRTLKALRSLASPSA